MEVAASIVGLLAAGAKISQFLEKLIQRGVNAPALVQDIRDEIKDLTFVLDKLHTLLPDSASDHDPNVTTSLTNDGHLATLVARCRATIRELEDKVPQVADGDELDMLDCMRWLWVEPALTPLLQRLEHHNKRLNLILTVLTYASVNRTFAQAPLEISPELEHSIDPQLYHRAFEQSLLATKPYRRIRQTTQGSELSWGSFERPIPRWSFMSGATNMGVRSLPLSPWDPPRYGTPQDMPDDPLIPESLVNLRSLLQNAGQTTPELRVDAECAQDEGQLDIAPDTMDGKPPAEEQDGESSAYLTVPQSHTTAVQGTELPPLPGLRGRNCMSFED